MVWLVQNCRSIKCLQFLKPPEIMSGGWHCGMSAEHRQHPHNQSRHILMKNQNYTEYIPVVPRYLTNSYELEIEISLLTKSGPHEGIYK
jgi:hypothetical protein